MTHVYSVHAEFEYDVFPPRFAALSVVKAFHGAYLNPGQTAHVFRIYHRRIAADSRSIVMVVMSVRNSNRVRANLRHDVPDVAVRVAYHGRTRAFRKFET